MSPAYGLPRQQRQTRSFKPTCRQPDTLAKSRAAFRFGKEVYPTSRPYRLSFRLRFLVTLASNRLLADLPPGFLDLLYRNRGGLTLLALI